ncbi:hypothetical protein FRC12_005080 [Ceratobasidium sp. 428]|nr:hypothetical protein FRC12_005080 [Ceratobasidium sp. 428]
MPQLSKQTTTPRHHPLGTPNAQPLGYTKPRRELDTGLARQISWCTQPQLGHGINQVSPAPNATRSTAQLDARALDHPDWYSWDSMLFCRRFNDQIISQSSICILSIILNPKDEGVAT